jgi:hypothetical protein
VEAHYSYADCEQMNWQYRSGFAVLISFTLEVSGK